ERTADDPRRRFHPAGTAGRWRVWRRRGARSGPGCPRRRRWPDRRRNRAARIPRGADPRRRGRPEGHRQDARFLSARSRGLAAGLIAIGLVLSGGVRADDTVTIGAIYRLTGAGGQSGMAAKAAIETAADIVNTPHKGLEALPLGAGQGLPHAGGAKIAVSF